MSLNCLCNALDRNGSAYREKKRRLEQHQAQRHLMVKRVGRNWSGNLIPSAFLHMHGSESSDDQDDSMMGPAIKKARKGRHRRGRSLVNEPLFGQGEPRLVRSSGMRRDWSFEDLKEHS